MPRNLRPPRRLTARPRHGATAVEFALVGPLCLLFVFTLIEFSWLNVVRHTAHNAAYEGARAAFVPGGTAADAVAEAERICATVGVRSATVTITPPTLDESTQVVTVAVTVPVDANTLAVARFTAGKSITTRSTLIAERARASGGGATTALKAELGITP